jgi:hypothetical protein
MSYLAYAWAAPFLVTPVVLPTKTFFEPSADYDTKSPLNFQQLYYQNQSLNLQKNSPSIRKHPEGMLQLAGW